MPRLSEPSCRVLAGGLRVHAARSPVRRALGLAWRRSMDPDVALHIPRCRSVHTFGMRFALDLIWLDAGGAVVRVDRDVRRRRLRSCRGARSVVEVAAGRADAFLAAGVATGSRSARRAST